MAEVREVDYPKDGDPTKLALYWSAELDLYKQWSKDFVTRSEKIEDRYVDKRPQRTANQSVLNLFWSNTEVILSALYARPPTVDILRSFRDPADDVARVAANMLERAVNNDIQIEQDGAAASIHDAILDRLVVGMGQVWVRYEVETAQQPAPEVPPPLDPITGQPSLEPQPPAEPIEVIVDEQSPLDYVRWCDYAFSPARRSRDVRWNARRVYMDKDKLTARFGEKIAESIPFTSKTLATSSEADPAKLSVTRQAEVWEIWCITHKKVYWYCKGAPTILDMKDDPLKLEGFFPCPKPLLATTTTGSLLPYPEYYMAQDQYDELDLVTTRIHLLVMAIRVVGVYDKTNEAIKGILSNLSQNAMIPVNNWAMFAEKGGTKGAVDWFPLEMVVNTLDKLTLRKQELINEIYQVLAISDIMRGMSNPNETATAQNLKAQFGGARMGKMQTNIGDFVSAAMSLKVQIMKNWYQPQTIVQKSQIERTEDAKYVQEALQLLKDPTFKYRVKVEEDSMASQQWLEEKQQRTALLQGLAQFIGMSMPLAQASPEAGPYLIKILN